MLAAASHPLAPAGAYVLAVAACPTTSRVAASTSSGDVAVYNAGLTRVGGGVHAPGAAVTGVALPADDAHVALSAGADGVVCVWDERAPGGPAARLASGTNKPLHSVTSLPAGRVAAGGDGRVCLWDARAGGKLAAAFTDAHDGDVTAVAAAGAWLLSAGVDGQLILWSLTGTLNEDDAFLATLNTGVSVAAAGWWAGGAKAFATTDINGVVTWNAAAAADEDAEGGGGADVDIDDVRPAAAAVAAPAEYVAGCVEVGGRLCLVTGDHGGALALLPLPDTTTAGTELPPAIATLTGGHTATVRAVCAAGDRVVSGGEDGRVIVWGRGGSAAAAPPPPTPATAAAHGKVRRHGGGSAARRPSPY